MTAVRSTISRSACAFGGSIAGRLLLSLLLLRRSGNRHWSILRSAQVAGNLVFVHRPGHEFIQHVLASGVELHGLALVPVFFLDCSVVGGDIQRVLAAFGIGLLELQGYGRERLRLGPF